MKTRKDVESSLLELLDPCLDKFIMGDTGLFNYNGSAHYCDRVALFEGWSRLLWAVGPFVYAGGYWSGFDKIINGLRNGTDPESEYYWGDVRPYDQRIVEMAAISLALMLNREKFWDRYSEREKQNIYNWFDQVNHREFSDNNWKFFRVIVNLMFEKLSLPFDESIIEKDLALIESYYVADGWYRDVVPFDNYNPFAFQYYSLIYYHFRKDKDEKRANLFKDRVSEFALQHINFFTDDGACVPYGRSLSYRFAVVSFYSACVFAGVEVLPWGILKGIILRNLRWWFAQPVFDRDGMLSVGYTYPNLIISEQYNAPGSPYWALKTYIMLAVGDNHPFWQAEELPLMNLPETVKLKVPGFLMQRTATDTIMLSAGQYPAYQMNHAAEKYSKFAYSANFGFSVSLSNYDFEKLGCDSMLYVSRGDGYWFQRRYIEDTRICDEYVKSQWSLICGVHITTWLFPAKDCHVRIHKIEAEFDIETKEGGFAIAAFNGFELETEKTVMIDNHSVDFSYPWARSVAIDCKKERSAEIIKPVPNLNYMSSCVEVPVLTGKVEKDKASFYCAVFGAVKGNVMNIPKVRFDENNLLLYIDGKKISFS